MEMRMTVLLNSCVPLENRAVSLVGCWDVRALKYAAPPTERRTRAEREANIFQVEYLLGVVGWTWTSSSCSSGRSSSPLVIIVAAYNVKRPRYGNCL